MGIALCTLYEGDYHHGVAALANSLHQAGFRGEFVVGVRGDMPRWAGEGHLDDASSRSLDLGPDLHIRFVAVDTPKHLTLFKPEFMAQVLNTYATDADVVTYIDPDIVVKCAWSDFSPWLESGGICLIEDVNGALPSHAPMRSLWRGYFDAAGLVETRSLDTNFNAGFVSVPRSHAYFLQLWTDMCSRAIASLGGTAGIKSGQPTSLFSTPDQDALNMALMLSDIPMRTARSAEMDFAPGGQCLSHAIGPFKPGHGRFVARALNGRPPSLASKHFLAFVDGPLRSLSQSEIRRLRTSQRLASLIGRFYRRA
ncbi:hypothetical protein [Demequina sediminis]|uniref:hypothetical protein n=1 Tax=Demequina sediminis TaxID=1930058 RepID=UPI0031EF55D3